MEQDDVDSEVSRPSDRWVQAAFEWSQKLYDLELRSGSRRCAHVRYRADSEA